MKYDDWVSQDDKHPLDQIFYILGNRTLLLSLGLLSISTGFYIAKSTCQMDWIARGGGLGVLFGTLLTLSPLFRNGIYLSVSIAFGFGSTGSDGKTSSTSKISRHTANNIVFGVFLLVISSVINVFGDKIGAMLW